MVDDGEDNDLISNEYLSAVAARLPLLLRVNSELSWKRQVPQNHASHMAATTTAPDLLSYVVYLSRGLHNAGTRDTNADQA